MDPVVQARKDIKFLVSLTRGLAALDEELEKVGGLKKIEQAAQSRIDELKATEDALANQTSAARSTLSSTSAQIDQARVNAEQIVADAQGQASAIVAQAKAEGEAIAATAAIAADAAVSAGNRVVSELNATKAKIDADITDARARLTTLIDQANQADARRDAANAEVERLQNLFGRKSDS